MVCSPLSSRRMFSTTFALNSNFKKTKMLLCCKKKFLNLIGYFVMLNQVVANWLEMGH